jgi:hypothetical protein
LRTKGRDWVFVFVGGVRDKTRKAGFLALGRNALGPIDVSRNGRLTIMSFNREIELLDVAEPANSARKAFSKS